MHREAKMAPLIDDVWEKLKKFKAIEKISEEKELQKEFDEFAEQLVSESIKYERNGNLTSEKIFEQGHKYDGKFSRNGENVFIELKPLYKSSEA